MSIKKSSKLKVSTYYIITKHIFIFIIFKNYLIFLWKKKKKKIKTYPNIPKFGCHK